MRAAMAISFMLLLAAALSVQGCGNPPEKEPIRITIDIAADGSLFLDGNAADGKELEEHLQVKFQTSPKEDIMVMHVSLLEVIIKTEPDVRYQSVGKVLNACSASGIRRTWFSNPTVNGGRDVKLWLPCGDSVPEEFDPTLKRAMFKTPRGETAGTENAQPVPDKTPTEQPVVIISEVRVKLVMAGPDDPEGKGGVLVLKIWDRPVMNGGRPDWEALAKHLRQALEKHQAENAKRPLSVTIDPEANVPFADVLRCVVVCQKLGFKHIFLAALQQ